MKNCIFQNLQLDIVIFFCQHRNVRKGDQIVARKKLAPISLRECPINLRDTIPMQNLTADRMVISRVDESTWIDPKPNDKIFHNFPKSGF